MPNERLQQAGAAVAAVLAVVGSFVLGARSGEDELRSARAAARTNAERVEQLHAERDRLRAERDRLETRLAAGRAAVGCPQPFPPVSARLLGGYSFRYPCGWHVVFQAGVASSAGGRQGLIGDRTLLSRLPISLARAAGPEADVEVVTWRDDPEREGDDLAPVDRWISEERARLRDLREEPIAPARTTGRKLSGTIDAGGARAAAVVLLWEFVDATASRQVVRVLAVAPSREVSLALNLLVRSFAVAAS